MIRLRRSGISPLEGKSGETSCSVYSRREFSSVRWRTAPNPCAAQTVIAATLTSTEVLDGVGTTYGWNLRMPVR